MSKAYISLTDKIEESTRCSDEDVDSFCESIRLLGLTDTTKNDGITKSAISSVSRETLSDLDGKFASRGDDESFDLAFFCGIFFRMKKLEDRDRKSSGLTRTSLCTTEKISSG